MQQHTTIKHPPPRKNKLPTARRPLVRSSSGSFLSTIKNIVTAPLAWFADHADDAEDARGKRRRVPGATEVNGADGDQSRSKRIRVESPEPILPAPTFSHGYLDPPASAFQYSPPQQPPRHFNFQDEDVIMSGPPRRSPSINLPQPRQARTASPLPYSRPSALGISRTMSMDPPSRRLSRDVTMEPLPSAVARASTSTSMSLSRELSMPLIRAPFRIRSSLTPQPSSPTLGPITHRRERDPSEPPPLTALMSNPIFVRRPPDADQQTHRRVLLEQPTLGSLMESQRASRSPSRRNSLLWGSQGGFISELSNSTSLHPINAAEKALHELDVYKTPLLPTRLKGATSIPDMFKPKIEHAPTLLRREDADKPRLGMSAKSRGKQKRQPHERGAKPYEGEGGLRKLLARRKKEEEGEHMEPVKERKVEKKEVGVMVVPEEGDRGRSDHDPEAGQTDVRQSMPPVKPSTSSSVSAGAFGRDSDSHMSSSLSSSSLRVGRTKTSRSHVPWPAASRPKNKFSAAFDDDGSDDGEERRRDEMILEEAAKKAPVFSVPEGFSFAKETAPIQHDTTNAKEPPITALPFSFSIKSTSTPKPVAPQGKETEQPDETSSLFSEAQLTPVSSTAATRQAVFSFGAPPSSFDVLSTAPEKGTPALPAPGAVSSIPDFFANSPALAKVSPPPPSVSSTLPAPVKDISNPLWDGDKGITSDTPTQATSIFGNGAINGAGSSFPPAAQSSTQPKPLPFGGFSAPTSLLSSVSGSNSEASSTIPALGGFSFGALALAKSSESTAPTSVFGAQNPGVGASTAAPLPFGMPMKSGIVSGFSFGAPAKPESKVSESSAATESSKPPPLFGSSSSFDRFGASSSTSSGADVAKPSFSFGQPSLPSSDNAIPSTQPGTSAQRAVFGSNPSGFSFGQPAPTPPSTANGVDTPKSPFAFGAAPATPPAAVDKKSSFSFGATPPATANDNVSGTSFSFGAPAPLVASSSGSDANKVSFSFGAPTPAPAPARPVTPKTEDQEIRMEESPTRELNGNGKANGDAVKTTAGFPFTAPSSTATGSPFGQPTQNGTALFSFGSSSVTPNPFTVKPDEKPGDKANPFGVFGRTASAPVISTGFSFGSKPAETTTSNVFGAPQSNPFAQPSTPTTTSPLTFGASATNGSAPGSPAFNQGPSFSFIPPSAVPNNPFSFGVSQPASPANANARLPQQPATPSGGQFTFGLPSSPSTANSGLPQAPGTPSGQFSFGQSNNSGAPPFGTVPPGGAVFNIGAAPTPSNRPVRKMPTRRGGKK